MVNKECGSIEEAVAGINTGATVMIGGFGSAGVPGKLVEGLIARGVGDLTVISNNAGSGEDGLSTLVREGRIRRMICSFPRQQGSNHFDDAYRKGRIALELVPQGNLAVRIQAGGSGLGGVYTPTGVGTLMAEGKEVRNIDGREYILEYALTADFALIKADRGDRWGNLVYRKTARNFGPIMAMAARTTIAQVRRIVPLGELDPEAIVTPGIFVQRLVVSEDVMGNGR